MFKKKLFLALFTLAASFSSGWAREKDIIFIYFVEKLSSVSKETDAYVLWDVDGGNQTFPTTTDFTVVRFCKDKKFIHIPIPKNQTIAKKYAIFFKQVTSDQWEEIKKELYYNFTPLDDTESFNLKQNKPVYDFILDHFKLKKKYTYNERIDEEEVTVEQPKQVISTSEIPKNREKTYYAIVRENKDTAGGKILTYRFIVIPAPTISDPDNLLTIDDLIALSKISTIKKFNDNTYLIENMLEDLRKEQEFQNTYVDKTWTDQKNNQWFQHVPKNPNKKIFGALSCKLLGSYDIGYPEWLPEEFNCVELSISGQNEDDLMWVNTKNTLKKMFKSVKKDPEVKEEQLKKIITKSETAVTTPQTVTTSMYVKSFLLNGLLGFLQNTWQYLFPHDKLNASHLITGPLALGSTYFLHSDKDTNNTGIAKQILPYVSCIASYAAGNMVSKLLWNGTQKKALPKKKGPKSLGL